MSAKNTTPHYWTEKETAYLRKAYAKGVDVDIIAKKLNRSKSVIYNRAKYLFILRDWEPVNKTQWTKRDIKFIQKNFYKLTNPQIAAHLGKKLTVVRNKCRELGLQHIELEYWTPEQVEFLKANYATMGNVEMAALFEVKYPKKKTWTSKHIEKKADYLGLKRSLEEQFRLRTNRFKAEDYKDFDGKKFPEGKIRIWMSNGKQRSMIKVGSDFVALHVHNWEKENGPIPEGFKLRFKDGNSLNCEPSNLELTTQTEIAKKVGAKVHSELSDEYIAGILSRSGRDCADPDLKKIILNQPQLLEAKRLQIQFNRNLKKQSV